MQLQSQEKASAEPSRAKAVPPLSTLNALSESLLRPLPKSAGEAGAPLLSSSSGAGSSTSVHGNEFLASLFSPRVIEQTLADPLVDEDEVLALQDGDSEASSSIERNHALLARPTILDFDCEGSYGTKIEALVRCLKA